MHFTFGKYNGKLIADVIATDIEYIKWLTTTGSVSWLSKEIEHVKVLAQPALARLEQQELETRVYRRPLLEPVIKAIKVMLITNKLKQGRDATDWFMSVFDAIQQGTKISAYAQELVADMCGKSQGRRNSKKYRAVKNTIEQSFNEAYN